MDEPGVVLSWLAKVDERNQRAMVAAKQGHRIVTTRDGRTIELLAEANLGPVTGLLPIDVVLAFRDWVVHWRGRGTKIIARTTDDGQIVRSRYVPNLHAAVEVMDDWQSSFISDDPGL